MAASVVASMKADGFLKASIDKSSIRIKKKMLGRIVETNEGK